nr:hypothetical protein [Tanacetum cinerariifolium]
FVLNLLLGEPAHEAERVFELVAVVGALGRGQDAAHLGYLHFADALQSVFYLLVLVVELGVVADVLPLAAAAGAKMLAKRRGAQL